MASNPMFGTAVNPTKSTAPTNSVNDSFKKYYQGRNTFNYSRPVHLTARYADITPFEAIHAVEGDVLELGNTHEIQTHTLKAPLKSDVYMKKFYGQVDMKAILPRTWNKFYLNPNFGDDIIPEDVNTYCDDFYVNLRNLASNLADQFDDADTDDLDALKNFFNNYFHFLILFEAVFSNGSVLSNLGCHSSALCTLKPTFNQEYGDGELKRLSFDKAFELIMNKILSYNFTFSVVDDSTILTASGSVGLRNVLSFIRHHHKWDIIFVDDISDVITDLSGACECLGTFFKCIDIVSDTVGEAKMPLNYDVLCAYQIICANFYSRDSVDNIYNAETYRDVMDYLWTKGIFPNDSEQSLSQFMFEYNGNKYLYDAFSGKTFTTMLYKFIHRLNEEGFYFMSDVWTMDTLLPYYAYFMNIFGYNPSLRYGDYFIGSRLEPLAVGDINAPVTGDGVNAIDMTIAISRARFFNAVNRTGRRPEDYIEDVTGGTLPPEITEPRFLASHSTKVRGFEVENTSEDQGNLVTILRSSSSNKVYSLSVGHPCIIIGVCTFEIQRVYSKTCDRFFFHKDRFDIFNKFMQYNGDQAVLSAERNMREVSNLDSPKPFAYTGRYMEYKQRIPIASGGFIEFLPGYLFVTDSDEDRSSSDSYTTLDEDYIRSKNYEIDTFYKSLTNFSLAGYFHFILDFQNICIAHRKMDYSPSIL